MNLRLAVLLVVLVLVGASGVVVLRLLPAPSPTMAPARETPKNTAPKPAAALPDPAGYEQVAVKVAVPPLSQFPAVWSNGHGCAHSQLSKVLGAQISQGNGVVVFVVDPKGPAAKAGILPGDRLGEPSECPSSLLGEFFPGQSARTVAWTVHRPKTAALREKALKEAAEHPMPGLKDPEATTPAAKQPATAPH